ncbi:hypothetical protein [Legionella tunisiensis]|uniref:hypothetical protein n=1 Tax=Legionella tunisiensis TaxID=1034944 RepID=UPI0002E4EDAD|nr:hypothetical protein [Legionella tunisiensis]
MPNIVIFNPIINDGIGDFVHWQELEPIIRAHFGNDCSICSFIVLQAGNEKNGGRIKRLVDEFNEATDPNQSQAVILEYPQDTREIDVAVNEFNRLLESNTELLEKIESCDAIIDLPLPCGLRWVLKDYIPGDFPPTTCITAIDEALVTTLHNYGPVIYDNYYEMTLTHRERKLNQDVLPCGVKFKKIEDFLQEKQPFALFTFLLKRMSSRPSTKFLV